MPVRSKRRVYLSGGMEYARSEGEDWRRKTEAWLKKELSHLSFNPNTASVRFLAKKGYSNSAFRALKSRNLLEYQRIVSQIVKRDTAEIVQNASYVICNWDRSAERGAGTKGEVTIAKLARKPVYVVTRIRPENIPGWILGCTTQLFSSFDDLKLFLKRKYFRNAKEGS